MVAKNVYHLQGSFSELTPSENPDYALGYLRKITGQRVVIKGLEHCYCNALLNYSGKLKLEEADNNHALNQTFEDFRARGELDVLLEDLKN